MKIRLIPILFFKNGNLIRSENFDIHQILGDSITQVKRYNSWDVDEIIYINISKNENFELKNKSFFLQIDIYSCHSFLLLVEKILYTISISIISF